MIPVQVGKEGVPGPRVEVLQKADLREAVRKALPEGPMEVEPAGVLRGVDRSHQQDKEEDLCYCREHNQH